MLGKIQEISWEKILGKIQGKFQEMSWENPGKILEKSWEKSWENPGKILGKIQERFQENAWGKSWEKSWENSCKIQEKSRKNPRKNPGKIVENLGKNPENIPGKVLGKILGKSRKISWKILGKNSGKIPWKIQEKSRYNPGKNPGKIPGKIQSISVHGWRLEWTEKVFQNDKSSWKKVRKKKNYSPLWSYPCGALGFFGRYTESEETVATDFIWLLFNSAYSIKNVQYLVLCSGRLAVASSIKLKAVTWPGMGAQFYHFCVMKVHQMFNRTT